MDGYETAPLIKQRDPLAARADRLRHRAPGGRRARVPGLLGRRRRLHLQAVRAGRSSGRRSASSSSCGRRTASSGRRPQQLHEQELRELERASADAVRAARRRDAADRVARGRRRQRDVLQRPLVRVHRDGSGGGRPRAVARRRPPARPRSRCSRTSASGEPFEVEFRIRGAKERLPVASGANRGDPRRGRPRSSRGSGPRPTSTTGSSPRSSGASSSRPATRSPVARLPRDAGPGRPHGGRQGERLVHRALVETDGSVAEVAVAHSTRRS